MGRALQTKEVSITADQPGPEGLFFGFTEVDLGGFCMVVKYVVWPSELHVFGITDWRLSTGRATMLETPEMFVNKVMEGIYPTSIENFQDGNWWNVNQTQMASPELHEGPFYLNLFGQEEGTEAEVEILYLDLYDL